MRLPSWLTQHVAALRALLVLTVLTGVLYPLFVTGVVQLPGLRDKADGSVVREHGRAVGSTEIGQSFTDAKGRPLVQYLQSRPSSGGYDPTATGASNLGPESVVDTLPHGGDAGTPSLLTQVCTRSRDVGRLEHVDGSRPYCTDTGVGAVLGVFRAHGDTGRITRVVSLNQACPTRPFLARYRGVRVECARGGADYSHAMITPIRGDAPAHPAVPADAVTASGSGLDPQISTAYAALQVPRLARERHVSPARVRAVVREYTTGRALGFMGEPGVNVLQVNRALDAKYPYRSNAR